MYKFSDFEHKNFEQWSPKHPSLVLGCAVCGRCCRGDVGLRPASCGSDLKHQRAATDLYTRGWTPSSQVAETRRSAALCWSEVYTRCGHHTASCWCDPPPAQRHTWEAWRALWISLKRTKKVRCRRLLFRLHPPGEWRAPETRLHLVVLVKPRPLTPPPVAYCPCCWFEGGTWLLADAPRFLLSKGNKRCSRWRPIWSRSLKLISMSACGLALTLNMGSGVQWRGGGGAGHHGLLGAHAGPRGRRRQTE